MYVVYIHICSYKVAESLPDANVYIACTTAWKTNHFRFCRKNTFIYRTFEMLWNICVCCCCHFHFIKYTYTHTFDSIRVHIFHQKITCDLYYIFIVHILHIFISIYHKAVSAISWWKNSVWQKPMKSRRSHFKVTWYGNKMYHCSSCCYFFSNSMVCIAWDEQWWTMMNTVIGIFAKFNYIERVLSINAVQRSRPILQVGL